MGTNPIIFLKKSATEHVPGNTPMKTMYHTIRSVLYILFCQNGDKPLFPDSMVPVTDADFWQRQEPSLMADHTTGTKMINTEDARRFNSLAKTALAPVNPIVARQITDLCGITEGTAIDIGSGPGQLAIEMARLTSLTIYALDISDAMRPIAADNIQQAGYSERIIVQTGDAAAIPFPDASADLIFSKGSAFFWDDLTTAFREIRRVLRPGGKAFIGGGFGNAATFAAVRETMDTIDPT